MADTFKNNIKFSVAAMLVATFGFWFNLEEYQKDRVATVIVRMIEGSVSQSGVPEQLKTLKTKMDIKSLEN